MSIDYHNMITIEPGKRSGKPCIRGLRITVYDVLSWLAEGMSRTEIVEDFPELTDDDITACLNYDGRLCATTDLKSERQKT